MWLGGESLLGSFRTCDCNNEATPTFVSCNSQRLARILGPRWKHSEPNIPNPLSKIDNTSNSAAHAIILFECNAFPKSKSKSKCPKKIPSRELFFFFLFFSFFLPYPSPGSHIPCTYVLYLVIFAVLSLSVFPFFFPFSFSAPHIFFFFILPDRLFYLSSYLSHSSHFYHSITKTKTKKQEQSLCI